MPVVDASVLVPALGDDGPAGDEARRLLRDERLFAPEIADLEVASVLRRQVHRGAMDERRAHLALEDLTAMPLVRVPHAPLLARCWTLRHNLTPYDAAYVAAAEILDTALVTADAAMAAVPGLRCHVRLVGQRNR